LPYGSSHNSWINSRGRGHFAQFEREVIAERTRDKMVAARRRGKWTGGPPVLGYDVHPDGGRIVVNEDEAARVRGIFQLYLELGSLLPVVNELGRRGSRCKRWTTRKGVLRGGKPFDRGSLYRLLTNPLYIGKVRCKGENCEGEHAAILDEALWERVQARIRQNGHTGGARARNRYGALLRGLLHCGSCGAGMTHTYTQKKGRRRYRYYVCTKAQKQGWATCPTKSVSAPEIEQFVVDHIRRIGQDPALIEETLKAAEEQSREGTKTLEAELRALERELEASEREIRDLMSLTATNGDGTTPATGRLAELQELMVTRQKRRVEVRRELDALKARAVDLHEVASALSQFDRLWETLSPRERARIVHLLVERVAYDGEGGKVSITFRPTGIKTLTEETTWAQA
jgi:site-specific DNA recombinase